MTATERLRQLLDERGVEWRRTPHYSSESMDNETVFCGIGIEWLASDHLNGRLGLRALKYEVTPEQAVEATMAYIEAEREVDRLQTENAKLRELVRDMCVWAYIDSGCDLEDRFADRMRELGIEVDG